MGQVLFSCFLLGSCVVPGFGEQLVLSLADCVNRGVANNLKLLSQRLARDEKTYDIDIARRIYIPKGVLEADTTKILRKLDYKVGVTKLAADGSKLGAQVQGKAYAGDIDNHDRRFVFSLDRPLLRNFGRRVTGVAVDLSKIDYDIGLEVFRSELNSYIANLAATFFELYFARKNYVVQEQSLARARKQYEETKHDIEAGVIPGQEVYLVEENVVSFEIKLESARRDIAWNELELKKLMNLDFGSSTRIIASESLDAHLEEPADIAGAMEHLKTVNPNYLVKKLYFKKAAINHEYYQNQLLPVLDFHLDYQIDRGGEQFHQNQLRAGLAYEVSLSRRADQARVHQARLEKRKTEVDMEDVETNYRFDLEKAFIDLDHQRVIYRASCRATELSQKKLDAETEKYKNGISTLADIVRFQKELEDSSIGELRTLITWNRIRIQRLLLEGILYKEFGIDIPTPLKP